MHRVIVWKRVHTRRINDCYCTRFWTSGMFWCDQQDYATVLERQVCTKSRDYTGWYLHGQVFEAYYEEFGKKFKLCDTKTSYTYIKNNACLKNEHQLHILTLWFILQSHARCTRPSSNCVLQKKKKTSTGIKRQWMTTNLRMPNQFLIQLNSIHLPSESNNTFKLILHPYTNIYP